MAIDISGIAYFMPIFSFIFVFALVFAIIEKTKILGESENKTVPLLISFFIAIIFVTTQSTRVYIEAVTPWIAVLIVALFFMLLIIVLSQRKIEDVMQPGFVWFFLILAFLIFLVSANIIFSHFAFWQQLKTTLTTNDRISGGLILIIIGIFATWILVRKYEK